MIEKLSPGATDAETRTTSHGGPRTHTLIHTAGWGAHCATWTQGFVLQKHRTSIYLLASCKYSLK